MASGTTSSGLPMRCHRPLRAVLATAKGLVCVCVLQPHDPLRVGERAMHGFTMAFLDVQRKGLDYATCPLGRRKTN